LDGGGLLIGKALREVWKSERTRMLGFPVGHRKSLNGSAVKKLEIYLRMKLIVCLHKSLGSNSSGIRM
jgi:hypothetical protein